MKWLIEFKYGTQGLVTGKFIEAQSWPQACELFARSANILGKTWSADGEISAEEFVRCNANGAVVIDSTMTKEKAWNLDLTGIWLVYGSPPVKIDHSALTPSVGSHEESVNPFEEV